MSLPRLLSYNNVKPRGVQTEHKLMRFTPLTSFNNYITNDIVRFWIPYLRGFWDPYKSYIEIEVEVSGDDFPYGTGIQVDNSASSFISQMTLFVDSQQIQRVQEYDTIAALLHDLMYMPADKFGKEYQGFGYAQHTSMGNNIDTRRTVSNSYGRNQRPITLQAYGTGATISSMGTLNTSYDTNNIYTSGYVPQRPIYITPKPLAYPVINAFTISTNSGSNITSWGSSAVPGGFRFMRIPVQQSGGVGSDNINIFGGGTVDTSISNFYNIFVRAHPQAFQYMFLYADAQYLPFSANNSSGSAQNFTQKNVATCRPTIQSYRQSTMYGVQSTNAYNFSLYPSAGYAQHSFTVPITNVANVSMEPNYDVSRVAVNGYTQAFSQQLTNASYEPLFAPAHGETWIHNGQFLSKNPIKTYQKVFQIPIISSLFGVLIPAQSYQLLPMAAFKNLMMEFRLNQYAMFTSGYKQTYLNTNTNTDSQAMTDLQILQRKWKINRFQIWGQVYMFDDFINSATDSALASGITISSSGWNIGPRFSLASTASIQNTWQINTGHQSLRTLCFRIQSDDYQKYSFCRQHYYYSGNITSLQIKIANTYIPPQPIQGHSGNIVTVGSQKNNVPFILQLHKTFGKLFNVGAQTYVNATNFAVNDRPYDITNTKAYRNATTGAVTNIDTAHSLPFFHQNRCVGRAVFAFDLQALPGQPQTISGLDTTKYRPFEVIIDSETTNHNGRDSTLVFILNFDVIYVLRAGDPPEVYGKGSS